MKYILKNLFFLFILIGIGCQNSNREGSTYLSDYTIHFRDYLNDIDRTNNGLKKGSYIIIPSNICPTCIEKLKVFISSDPNSERITFILPGRSYKNIRLTFDDEIISLDNVWLDDKGKWYKDTFLNDEETAKIIYTYDDKVVKVVPLYPVEIDFELSYLSGMYIED